MKGLRPDNAGRIAKILALSACIMFSASVEFAGAAEKTATSGKGGVRPEMAEVCFDCHFPSNGTSDPLVPKLDGQLRSFLIKAINYYKTGARKDTVMSTVLEQFNLTDKVIEDIADFYSKLPPMKGSGMLTATGRKGRKIFIEQKCIFCHDEYDKSVPSYIGETVLIGGQNKSFLIKSMMDIRDRARLADDFDLMSRTVKHLKDDEIEAVAEYLSVM